MPVRAGPAPRLSCQPSRRPAALELEGESNVQGRRCCLSDPQRKIAPTWGAGRVRTADHTGVSAICENARGRGRVVLVLRDGRLARDERKTRSLRKRPFYATRGARREGNCLALLVLLSTSLLYIRASAVREQGPAPSPVPRLKGTSRSDGRCLVTGQHATAHDLKQGLPLGLGMGSSRKAPCQAD